MNIVHKKLCLIVAFASILVSYPFWKQIGKRNRWFVIATNVGQDTLRRWGMTNRQVSQGATLTCPANTIPAQLEKARSIYRMYLQYAHLTQSSVSGMRVIELGPGYNVAVPLLFAADGASLVVGIDKFVPLQEGADFGFLYQCQRDTLSAHQQSEFDRAISLTPKVAIKPGRAAYIYNQELPACIPQLGAGTYDLIVSNAVIEEIYDPTPTFTAQDRLLRPGGIMVHRIDLGDYGMFSRYGFNPLEFLTVPEWFYLRMAKGSGEPNRRLIDYYRDIGRRMGYQTEIYITRAVGAAADFSEPRRELRAGFDYCDEQVKLIREIRSRLPDRFSRLPDVDLLASGIILVGQKPVQ